MAKAKRENITTTKPTKDQRIIEACVTYGVLCGAINGAFKTDPDPDNKNAEAATDALYNQRWAALKTAGGKAETLESIMAKASVLSLMIEEKRYTAILEQPEFDFAASFARDVEKMFSNWLNLGYCNSAAAIKAVQS